MKKFIMVLVGMFVLGLNSVGAISWQELTESKNWVCNYIGDMGIGYEYRVIEKDNDGNMYFYLANVDRGEGLIRVYRTKVDKDFKYQTLKHISIYNLYGYLVRTYNTEQTQSLTEERKEVWRTLYSLQAIAPVK